VDVTSSGRTGSDADAAARPVLVRPTFLTPTHSSAVIDAFLHTASRPITTTVHRRSVRVMPHRREVDGRFVAHIGTPETAKILASARASAIDAIKYFYQVEEPLDIEFTLLTEMGPGDRHPLHADNERQEPDGTWVPNHTPVRDFVAILYLNTGGVDFEGGILHFPVLHRKFVLAAGDLVGFTCGREHRHEVTPVIRGRRYTLSMWMTTNPTYAEIWK
jgi:hypothetical protein